MRVLLVEDDEMIGQSLRDALDANGWSVDWVKDGLLAQSALEDGDYACVLLDLGLPKRDGIEVLRKARSQGNQTPVIASPAWTSAPTTTCSSPTNSANCWPGCER
jgi:DNA-binding response OmpR family regulator